MTMLDRLARAMYASSCALDPIEVSEPNWGRGGYKTEVLYWEGLARTVLHELLTPTEGMMAAFANRYAHPPHEEPLKMHQAAIQAAIEGE